MKAGFFALFGLFALGAQARFTDLRELITDDYELTAKGADAVANGMTRKRSSNPYSGDSNTPMNVQMMPGTYSRTQDKAQYFTNKGSQRATLKYGPFNVPSMDSANGMVDYLQLGASMPCADCTITWMRAGLEYPNGTYANSNTSLWLHHTVFINLAHPDTVCGSNYYAKGQRWFASGNERTITDFTIQGTTPVGYYLGLMDYHIIEIELMNQEMMAQEAVMTVEYEYIMGKPSGFQDITPIWFDIAGCDIPSDMPVINDKSFTYSMNQTFAPNYSGAIVGLGAHLHDGGTHLTVSNKGQEQCDSVAYYGAPGYNGPSMDMTGEMQHISYMSSCYAPYAGEVTPQDAWNITAYYDFTKHAAMTNTDGSLEDIMGISVMYTVPGMTMEQMASYRGKEVNNPNPPQPASLSSYMVAAPTATAGMGGMSGMGGMRRSFTA